MDTHVEEEKEGINTSRWGNYEVQTQLHSQTVRSGWDGRDSPSHLDHRCGIAGGVDCVGLFPDYQATAAVYPDAAIWAMYPSRSYLPQKVRIY